jgi:predicted ATP-dependent endonuclease of OLD family
MIKNVEMSSYGPIEHLSCSEKLQNINLLIGANGSGETFFLKALYSALRTVEQYQRDKEPKTEKDLLFDALYWTFEARSLGDLVKKGKSALAFTMVANESERFSYSFGTSTQKNIQNLTNTFRPTMVNSLFVPAKEIVTVQDIILKSYDVDRSFGFDKTYVDLARALSKTLKGRNYKEFSSARKSLYDAIGGKIEYDIVSKEWVFRDKERRVIQINLTSEGTKRLAVLDSLLGNHYLSRDSVVIIDEAEANLHPSMVGKFVDILVQLAKAGLQIFISSHSYFVIKKIYILAHKNKISVPVLSFDSGTVTMSDLSAEMPDNPIINESISLYEEEIQL